MINVIDKINNLGIISRIVSHRFAKRNASKIQINDVCLLLSGLSGINPSADAKMYLTLPSMDGDRRAEADSTILFDATIMRRIKPALEGLEHW